MPAKKKTYYDIRKQICEVGKRLYDKSYISGTGGNISVMLANGNVLITPSKRNKGFLKPDEIVMIDMDGRELEKGITASSEKLVHLHFYKNQPGITSVIHAHPPAATAYAIAGLGIDCSYSPETMVFLGERVPLVPYATPSTQALPDSFNPYIDAKTHAYLMQNHGAVTTADSLEMTYNNMETLELYARTLMYAKVIDSAKPISPAKIKHLKEIFHL